MSDPRAKHVAKFRRIVKSINYKSSSSKSKSTPKPPPPPPPPTNPEKQVILDRVRDYNEQPIYTPPRQSEPRNIGTRSDSGNVGKTTVKTSKSTYDSNNPYGTSSKVISVRPKTTPQYTVTSTTTGKSYTGTTRAEAERKKNDDEQRQREARERAERAERQRQEQLERERLARLERERLERERQAREARERAERLRIQNEKYEISKQLKSQGVPVTDIDILHTEKQNDPKAVQKYVNLFKYNQAVKEYNTIQKQNMQKYNSQLQSYNLQYDRTQLARFDFEQTIKKNPLDYSSRYDYGIEKDYNIARDTASSFLQPFTAIPLTIKNVVDQTWYGGKDQYHIHESGIGSLITGGITDLINLPSIVTGKTKPTVFDSWDKATKYYEKNPNRLFGELAGEVALGIITGGAGLVAKAGLKAINPITKTVVQIPGEKAVNLLVRKSTNEVVAAWQGTKVAKSNWLDIVKPERLMDYQTTRGGGEIHLGARGQAVLSQDTVLDRMLKKGAVDQQYVDRTKATRDAWLGNTGKQLSQTTEDVTLKGTTQSQSKSMFEGLRKAQQKYGITDIHGSVITRSVLDEKLMSKTGIKVEPGDIDAPIKLGIKDIITGRAKKIKDKAIMSIGENLKTQLKPGESISYEGLGGKGNRGLYLTKPDGSKIKKAEVIDNKSPNTYGKGTDDQGYLFGKKIDYRSQTYNIQGQSISGIRTPAQLAENLKQTGSIQKIDGKLKVEPDPGRAKDVRRSFMLLKQEGLTNPKADIAAENLKRAYPDFFPNPKGTGLPKPKGTIPKGTGDDIISQSVVRSSITQTGKGITSNIGKGVASSLTRRSLSTPSSRPPKPPTSKIPSKIPTKKPNMSKVPAISLIDPNAKPPSRPPSKPPSRPPVLPPIKPPPSDPYITPPPRRPMPQMRLPPSRPVAPIYNPGEDPYPPKPPPVRPPPPSIITTPTPPIRPPPPTPPIIPGKKRKPPVRPFWLPDESKSKVKTKRSSSKNKQFVGNTFKDYFGGFTGDREITYGKGKQLKQKSIKSVKRRKKKR